MSDQVRDLLDRLDGDVERMPGADVTSVRRRGDRRRRRQQALVAAGSAVAVVAVALLPLGLHGFSGSDETPGTSNGPSTSATTPVRPSVSSVPQTASPTPSLTPTPEFSQRFLTPAELPGPATSGARWRAVDQQPGSAVAKCVDPTGFSTNASADLRWFATTANPVPGDEIAFERLLSFSTVGEASSAVASLISAAKSCSYNAEPVLTPGAGDEAKTLYFRYDDGADHAASMQSLVVVRVGARLAVLVVAMDGNGDIPYIESLQTKLPGMLAEQLQASASS